MGERIYCGYTLENSKIRAETQRTNLWAKSWIRDHERVFLTGLPSIQLLSHIILYPVVASDDVGLFQISCWPWPFTLTQKPILWNSFLIKIPSSKIFYISVKLTETKWNNYQRKWKYIRKWMKICNKLLLRLKRFSDRFKNLKYIIILPVSHYVFSPFGT